MEKLLFVLSFFLLSLGFIPAQTTEITGVVLDEMGEPILGATISVKGTNIYAATNAAGKFTLNVPEESETLWASYVGMLPQEAPVTTYVKIKLQPNPSIYGEGESFRPPAPSVVIEMDMSPEDKSLVYPIQRGDKPIKTSQRELNKTSALSGSKTQFQEGMDLLYQTISGFDEECFLIGTMYDDGGHQQTFTVIGDSSNYQMVDVYLQEKDEKVALLIDFLFKDKFPDLQKKNVNSKNISPIFRGKTISYSSPLSTIVNSYYDYKLTGRRSCSGDIIYVGSINKEKIKTESQKLSFLAGVYFRDGAAVNDSLKTLVFRETVGTEPRPNTYWIRAHR
jgi:hypothetical protein